MSGLHSEGGAGLTGLLDQLQWLCRGQVNDVAPHPETYLRCQTIFSKHSIASLIKMLVFSLVLQTEPCDNANGLCFHDVWPGLQKGGVLAGIFNNAMRNMLLFPQNMGIQPNFHTHK